MDRLRNIRIGLCSSGPVALSHTEGEHYKFVIAIASYEKNKDDYLLSCKTTSKHHDAVYPGEFIIPDLFKRGPSKIQPYNICRVTTHQLTNHQYVGILDASFMKEFELGLKIAVKRELLTPAETLVVLDSWQSFFSL